MDALECSTNEDQRTNDGSSDFSKRIQEEISRRVGEIIERVEQLPQPLIGKIQTLRYKVAEILAMPNLSVGGLKMAECMTRSLHESGEITKTEYDDLNNVISKLLHKAEEIDDLGGNSAEGGVEGLSKILGVLRDPEKLPSGQPDRDKELVELDKLLEKRNAAKLEKSKGFFEMSKLAILQVLNKSLEEDTPLMPKEFIYHYIAMLMQEKFREHPAPIICRAGPSSTHETSGMTGETKRMIGQYVGHATPGEWWLIKNAKQAARDVFGYDENSEVVFTEGGTKGMELVIKALARRGPRTLFIVHEGDAFSQQIYLEACDRRRHELSHQVKGHEDELEKMEARGMNAQYIAERRREIYQLLQDEQNYPRVIQLKPKETFAVSTKEYRDAQKLISDGEVDTVICLTNTTPYGHNNLPAFMELKRHAINNGRDHEVLFIGDHVSGRVFNLVEELTDKELVKGGYANREEARKMVLRLLPDVMATAFQKDIAAEDGPGGAGFAVIREAAKARKRANEIIKGEGGEPPDPSQKGKISFWSKVFEYYDIQTGKLNRSPETPNILPFTNWIVTEWAFNECDGELMKREKTDRARVRKFMMQDCKEMFAKQGIGFFIENPENHESDTTYAITLPSDVSAAECRKLLERFSCFVSTGYRDKSDRILRLCYYSANVPEDFEVIIGSLNYILTHSEMRKQVQAQNMKAA